VKKLKTTFKVPELGVLTIYKGLAAKAKGQLLAFSQTDEAIKKFTADEQRFEDEKAFLAWRRKGRVIYTLLDEKGDLKGIIWLGKKALDLSGFRLIANIEPEKYSFTFAIRLYENARGKGLAVPFMQAVLADFGQEKIWLETGRDNEAALKTYRHFGFRAIAENENQRILMAWEKESF
jgi:ribosomal protein S18 acetylase RimI-like enzyme